METVAVQEGEPFAVGETVPEPVRDGEIVEVTERVCVTDVVRETVPVGDRDCVVVTVAVQEGEPFAVGDPDTERVIVPETELLPERVRETDVVRETVPVTDLVCDTEVVREIVTVTELV